MKKIKVIENKYNPETMIATCCIEGTNGLLYYGEASPKGEDLEAPSSFLGCRIAEIRAIQENLQFLIDLEVNKGNEIINLKNSLNEKEERKRKKYNKQITRIKEKIDKYKQKKQDLEQNINDMVIKRRIFLKQVKEKKNKKEDEI